MTLQDCLEYCQKQNGLDYCKNCGLNIEMLNKAIAEERERVREEINPLIEEIGSGAFSRDPMTHAENTITRAKEIGQKILSSLDKPDKGI